MFLGIDSSPLSPSLVNRFLTEMSKAVHSLETSLDEGVGVEQSSRDGLHHLKDLHRVADSFDLKLAHFENGECDPEQGSASLVEE